MSGATVCVSTHAGEIEPEGFEGLFHRDVRVLSQLVLTLDGRRPALLSAQRLGASAAELVYVAAVDEFANPTALLLRRREIGAGLRETLTVRVFSGALEGVELRVGLGTDFADLLPLKHTVERTPSEPLVPHGAAGVRVDGARFGIAATLDAAATRAERGALVCRVDAAPGRPWSTTLVVEPVDLHAGGGADPPRDAAPREQLEVRSSARRWEESTASAVADLHGLRVEAPRYDLTYIAAGAPWFMALFGRDTLLAAWESLLLGPRFGLEVLSSLARFQGREVDDRTGEQPGRILHELRTGEAGVFGVPPGTPYYGTVDASPLFVMLLAEVHRWGAGDDQVRLLLPAARAALRWCVEFGDLDGDGYVEYAGDVDGLVNQGWKDSGDSMVHADGSQAKPPIALAEVQGYLYGAYVALATLEERLGDPAEAARLRRSARALQDAFVRDFWLPEQGLVAMALDREKQPLAVASSNPGHCLWTGLLDGEVGAAAAARLEASDLTTPWGVRTLGSGEVAYNPLGYHLGTIWPHDSALVAAGLVRAGSFDAARGVTEGLLAAAERFGWRLPELFAALDDLPFPVPYPVACSPQAWSAAAPLLLLRTMLRLEPDVPAGVVRCAPLLSDGMEVTATGIGLGAGRLDLRVRGHEVEVLAAPPGIEVVVG